MDGLLQHWERAVAEKGDAVALLHADGRRWSWRDIDAMADERARRLRGADLAARSIVLLRFPNGAEWLAWFVAVLRHRCIAVCADADMSEAEALKIATRLRMSVTVSEEGIHNATTQPRRLRDPNLSVGKLTSGSTGGPKCLLFSDTQILDDGQRTAAGFGVRSEDLILSVIPWGHAYGIGSIVGPLLLLRLKVGLPSGHLPEEIASFARKYRPTVFPAVPTLLKALAACGCAVDAFRSVRVLITAGSRLDPGVARAFLERYGVTPRNLYGSSETGSICVDTTGEDTLAGRSVGTPLEGVVVERIRDGRLWVCSSSVYVHGNRNVTPDGLGRCLVSDRGHFADDGALVITGRVKGFVKVGEKRVGLADVEARLAAIPGVEACQALAMEREGHLRLGAVVESRLGRREVARAMRAELPAKFRPKFWVVVEQLPRTARGKVNAAAMRALIEQHYQAS